ncbi:MULTISPECIES: flagellar export chaperone FlgN [unclassified Pseudomonas]|uniref:flagella synthesis protein FlgN n=1 Tax=unclassified Pseudomonas TaxID=196821 RepID=UPI002447728D|nr:MULTISPECIES: flagellar export chaperone FlgN [unclassified Pseudomonas]MDG9927178.1 flagellar export chaperone FlgN [Pseudomonas sp. GD04042]MDH0482813.1 flagellar export chaperone FlgN [Pseudomonas sp. GD04015]MDH0602593.1 flagellar export chaperone FlgN [Pseudomonas sp. GD03869]MDH0893124.1 flagellar export chaperone FlgN [Pseudomonas sp. GD03875]MDH1063055.1 flagellar export chaperone FlgN [Pseudomonas sp. GD03985]
MQNDDLLHLFIEDIGTAQRLLELIDTEFQAMGERDLPRLEQILGEKLPLLGLLDQHGTARASLLSAQQLSADRAGLETLASRRDDGAELLARSEELNRLLESCRDANQRNGRLIRANQASLKSVLGILRGGETPGLYDSRGGAARIAQQRPLSQA